MPETEQTKTPHLTAGFRDRFFAKQAYRARRPEVPGWGPFFETIAVRGIMTIRK